jgi:hypothetical protein
MGAEAMDGSERQHRERKPANVGGGADGVVDLHLCPDCGSGLVYPLDWMAMDAAHWRVSLRCPECEWRSVGLFEQAVLDRFDRILDAGTETLYADLRNLERVNMEDELRRFNAALGEDLVLPEDF